MNNVNWILIIVALIGGGAMGAIISQIFIWRRNKIQSVGQNIDLKPIFNSEIDNKILSSKIILEDIANQKVEFENIWIATIIIANKGNSDFKTFELGINLKNNAEAVRVIPTNSNRHHQVVFKNEPQLNKPKQEIDLTIKPFNRNQVYEIEIYLTSKNKVILKDDLELISPQSIKFVEIKDFTEVIGNVLEGVTISFLGNQITFGNK